MKVEFQKWRKANYMVHSWILGSLSKELKERFTESNGPTIYKIQREITSIQQGNNNLANYFNKLEKLWEDLNTSRPFPSCSCGGCRCGISRKLTEMDSSTRIIQFLMGLSEVFDVVKNHILMQEPLPNTDKAYSMLQNVESQKIVHKNFEEVAESNIMMVKTQCYLRNGNKGGFKKREGEKKED